MKSQGTRVEVLHCYLLTMNVSKVKEEASMVMASIRMSLLSIVTRLIISQIIDIPKIMQIKLIDQYEVIFFIIYALSHNFSDDWLVSYDQKCDVIHNMNRSNIKYKKSDKE
jgi:hypothetical protein